MNIKTLIIKSRRLKLVPIRYKYTKDIFNNFTKEITSYMYPVPAEKISQSREFIRDSMKKQKEGKEIVFVILKADTEEFIGCVGLHEINTKTPELGIWTKKSAHGNGYGLEAVSAVIEFARNNFKIEYFIYPVDRRNIASKRIPEYHSGVVKGERVEISIGGDELQILEYWIY